MVEGRREGGEEREREKTHEIIIEDHKFVCGWKKAES